MLSRRDFLKLIAASFGSALVSACNPATPLPTAPAPTLTVPTATPQPTATATTTATATFTPTWTPTLTATPSTTPTATATPRAIDFMTVRGDQFYLRGERFPIRGFNYYPSLHPWRMFNVGEWEPDVAERELRAGASLGANVVRVFIDFNYSFAGTPTPTPLNANAAIPNAQYVANVREFLDIAGRLNLKVILTLLDSLDFGLYQPSNFGVIEAYLRALIPTFARDPRIVCWDLQNEPDKAISTVGDSVVIPFFQRVSQLVRALDPYPLQTIGWIDRARAKYLPALNDYLDFWCFHYYDTVDRLDSLIKFYKTQTRKPVLLQEFGLPTGGPSPEGKFTENDQVIHYNAVMKILEDNQMCGSVFWCLNDFPIGLAGNPPLKTDSAENHFGVLRLDYSEKPVTQVIRWFWKAGNAK